MRFIVTHATALLYAGFWISLSTYGLMAPPHRVTMLESGAVTEGWHLSLMALVLGGPVLVLYVRRMRR